MRRDLYTFLMYARKWPLIGRLAYFQLKLLGVEIPLQVKFGTGCMLLHGGFGVVIHPQTEFAERVKIYPGVTLGRADIHHMATASKFKGIRIGSDAILCSGAKVLCKEGILTVGKGSIVGANAVLLHSTGENEIWAGIPARCIGLRD
jgi:serine O-acetyltransferase